MIASHPAVTGHAAVLERPHLEMDIISDMARWVADQVRRGAERFVLLQRGDAHQAVDEWLVEEMDNVHSLAYAIHSTGIREALGSRDSTSYVIYSLRPGSSAAISRYSFRVDCSGGGHGSGAGAPPDERGIVALMMSHTEMAARLSLGNAKDIVDQYQRLLEHSTKHLTQTLEQAHARIRELEAREMEAFELRDKLLGMTANVAAERDLRLEELKGKLALQAKALDRLGPLAVAGVTKLLGPGAAAALGLSGAPANEASPGAAGAPTPETPPSDPEASQIADLLGALIPSMTEDQMQRLFGVLREAQVPVFLKLYELSDARTKRKAASAPSQESAAESTTASTVSSTPFSAGGGQMPTAPPASVEPPQPPPVEQHPPSNARAAPTDAPAPDRDRREAAAPPPRRPAAGRPSSRKPGRGRS